ARVHPTRRSPVLLTPEDHERIADQAGGRLVGLRQKADAIGDDVLAIRAARASDLALELAEQGRAASRGANVEQRPKRVEQLAGRGASARQLFARRRRRDASGE